MIRQIRPPERIGKVTTNFLVYRRQGDIIVDPLLLAWTFFCPAVPGLAPPGDVEGRQDAMAQGLVAAQVAQDVTLLADLGLDGAHAVVSGVVGGTLFRIGKHVVGLHQHAEALHIPRIAVVRVVALGQETENALDGFLVHVGADLQALVVVEEFVTFHRVISLPNGSRTRTAIEKEDRGGAEKQKTRCTGAHRLLRTGFQPAIGSW